MNIKLAYLNDKEWKLLEDVIIENILDFKVIKVPKNFICDLASIPRALWSIFPKHGKYIRAAIIHDFLYRLKEIDRKLADKVFYEVMLLDKVPKWKAYSFYRFVRTFGGIARKGSLKKFEDWYLVKGKVEF